MFNIRGYFCLVEHLDDCQKDAEIFMSEAEYIPILFYFLSLKKNSQKKKDQN